MKGFRTNILLSRSYAVIIQLDSVKNSCCKASSADTREKGFRSNSLLSRSYAESGTLAQDNMAACSASVMESPFFGPGLGYWPGPQFGTQGLQVQGRSSGTADHIFTCKIQVIMS